MLGLMLIEPEERGKGLGNIVHEALVDWAKDLGAKSFRIGVIEENFKGMNFWSDLGYTTMNTKVGIGSMFSSITLNLRIKR